MLTRVMLLILASELFRSYAADIDYCLINKKHIFCKDANYKKSSNCPKTKIVPLTDNMKEETLHFFNHKRQETSRHINAYAVDYGYAPMKDDPKSMGLYRFLMPPAANMIQLEWHDKLAMAAKTISEFCDDKLKFCPSCLLIDGMFATWAYIFLKKSNVTWEGYYERLQADGKHFRAIEYPYPHKKNFYNSFLLPYRWRNNASIQYINSVLHSGTKYVGCGRTTSWKNSATHYFETCLFAPLPDEDITILYKKGLRCTSCPRRYVCSEEYEGLCTKSRKGIGKPLNYCKINVKHILCSDWNTKEKLKNAAICAGKKLIELDQHIQFEILQSYNNFRKDIALGRSDFIKGLPKAADMIELEWDYELQRAAEVYLNTCSQEKLVPGQLQFGKKGELQAKVVSILLDGSDFQEALSKAIGLRGIQLTRSLLLNYRFDEKYDKLSALAFSQTRHMGCARQTLSANAHSRPLMNELCVFATTEEMKSTKVSSKEHTLYIEGRKCSRCPNGFQCKRGLCKAIDSGIDIPEDFCDIDKKHILCDYWKRAEEIGDTKLCQGKAPVNVTELDKAEILVTFNKLRKNLALGKDSTLANIPSAANMLELKWNDDLQEAAERILHICSTKDLEVGQMKFGHHGELQARITRLSHNEENFQEKLTIAFRNEGQKFDPTHISNYSFDGKDNLFTTLAFAQARYLGCARLTPAYGESEPNEFEEVCVIGPTEKESGNNLYITGEACTNCPENYECDEGLCDRVQHGIDTPIDYCKIHKNHMLCNVWDRVQEKEDNSKCLTNKAVKHSKEVILFLVNRFRRELAFGVKSGLESMSKAADMNELEWDSELEEAATNIALLCNENAVSSEQLKFGLHGELKMEVVYLKHNSVDFKEAFANAIEEGGKLFQQFQQESNENNTENEHYTLFKAFAVSTARFVGCALQMKSNQTEKTNKFLLEVCIVGPVAEIEYNMNSLFTKGFPCSKCKYGFECNVGLCKQKRFGLGRAVGYCNTYSRHILCNLWENRTQDIGRPELCVGKVKTEITEPDKVEILSTYNQLRRDLALGKSQLINGMPKAADMNELVWDSNLQEAAENILYVCSTKNLRSKQLYFGPHGEYQGKPIYLFFEGKNYAEALSVAVKEEAGFFDKTHIPSYLVDEKYDMFTAIVFSKANYLGCARLKPSYKSPTLPNSVAEVCVIAGTEHNFTDYLNRLYREGDECTKCQYGFECFNGLCRKARHRLDGSDQYCEIWSKHVLCPEWDPIQELGDSSNCVGRTAIKLTEQNKFDMLNSFNRLRRDLAGGTSDIKPEMPKSSNMFEIEWDKELYRAALKILHGCIPLEKVSKEMLKFGHHGEIQTHKIFYVHDGANFGEELKKTIKKEATNFTIENLYNYRADEQYGTFTSSAYSAARFLGCARTEMTEGSKSVKKFSDLCIIGPIGKEEYNQLFSKGEACSNCPPRSDCDDGLCKLIRVGIAGPDDYCDLNIHHILCNKENLVVGSEDANVCNGETMQQLTNTEKSAILSNYNQFRQEIAKGSSVILQSDSEAANMIELEYDNKLEEAAENLLFRCDTENISPDMMTFGHHGELQANKITIVHDGSNFEEALKMAVEKEALALDKFQIDEYEKTSMITTPYNGIIAPLVSCSSRYIGCARRTPADQPNMITEVCVIGGTKRNGEINLFASGIACSKCYPGYTCIGRLCRAPRETFTPDSQIVSFYTPEPTETPTDSYTEDFVTDSFTGSSAINTDTSFEYSPTVTTLQPTPHILHEEANSNEELTLHETVSVTPAPTTAAANVQTNIGDAANNFSKINFFKLEQCFILQIIVYIIQAIQ